MTLLYYVPVSGASKMDVTQGGNNRGCSNWSEREANSVCIELW